MQPIEPEKLNPGLIMLLARDNVTVNAFMSHWQRGGLSFEQALIGMVAHLVEHNKELSQLNIDRISRNTEPTILRWNELEK